MKIIIYTLLTSFYAISVAMDMIEELKNPWRMR